MNCFFSRRVYFIFLLVFLSLSQSFGQQQVLNQKISLSIYQRPLREVLHDIEQVADVKFLFQSNVVVGRDSISISAAHESLGSVLSRLFSSLEIRYELDGNHIILNQKKQKRRLDNHVE